MLTIKGELRFVSWSARVKEKMLEQLKKALMVIKMPLVSNTLIVVKNESDLEDLEDDLDVEEKVGMNEDK